MLCLLVLALLVPWRPACLRQVGERHSAEVLRVLDGDTFVVRLEGGEETLRLLCVDTEEKLSNRPTSSAGKPETVFGEETARWAAAFFEELGGEAGAAPRVELVFPPRRERRDAFGRLLGHVFLEDGRHFNRLLIEGGWSPYYVKYGRSRVEDAALAAAERAARRARRGVWHPATNRATTPGAPEAVRPYGPLRAWWSLRAAAVAAFRGRSGEPELVAADDADAIERALRARAPDASLSVFGEVARLAEEVGGALTARLRSSDRERALTVHVPPDLRGGALETLLVESTRELQQNYVTLRGPVLRQGHAFRMLASDVHELALGCPAAPTALASSAARHPPTLIMSTEIELKFAVDDEAAFDALVRHLDLATREFHTTIDQVNHFFDTPSFALHERKVTLRLREENRRHLLTLKGPAQQRSGDGVATERMEVEVRLAPEVALDVLQGTISPRDALAQRIAERNPQALRLLDEALGDAELHYAGRFENRRTTLTDVPLELDDRTVSLNIELDRTTFTRDRIDHEIEVEVGPDVDVPRVHARLVELLAAAGVAWHPAESKARRFFELAR